MHDGTVGRTAGAGRTGSSAGATNDLSEASRRLRRPRASASRDPKAAGAAKTPARSSRAAEPRHGRSADRTAADVTAARPERKARTGRSAALMRYANDNRLVQAIHGLLAGPFRFAFYAAVAAAVALGLYFPVRDLYIAHRTQGILTEQLAIRERYNEQLEKQVESYTSNEGLEDAARKELGMVEQGERRIVVTGTDENGDPVIETEDEADGSFAGDASAPEDAPAADGGSTEAGSSSAPEGQGADEPADAAGAPTGDPRSSAEVERAVAEVYDRSPWYLKVLDALFLFRGTEGQAVVSTGDPGSAGE